MVFCRSCEIFQGFKETKTGMVDGEMGLRCGGCGTTTRSYRRCFRKFSVDCWHILAISTEKVFALVTSGRVVIELFS